MQEEVGKGIGVDEFLLYLYMDVCGPFKGWLKRLDVRLAIGDSIKSRLTAM